MTTQAQKEFLINAAIDQMTVFLMEDYHLELPAALELVYNSQLYEKIINLDTGLYFQSAAYNYELLKHEIDYGKIG
jgi:hypothetical protein